MAGVCARYGESPVSAHLVPLCVDGLVVAASISLVELAGRIRAVDPAATQSATSHARTPARTASPGTGTRTPAKKTPARKATPTRAPAAAAPAPGRKPPTPTAVTSIEDTTDD